PYALRLRAHARRRRPVRTHLRPEGDALRARADAHRALPMRARLPGVRGPGGRSGPQTRRDRAPAPRRRDGVNGRPGAGAQRTYAFAMVRRLPALVLAAGAVA